MTVLILSTSTNEHADRILRSVTNHGATVIRINTDSITDGSEIFSFSPFEPDSIVLSNHPIHASEIRSVFVHHPDLELAQGLGLDPIDRDLAISGWRNYLNSLEVLFNNARWLNKPSLSRQSANVSFQLRAAHTCGFRVPRTLFSNEQAAVGQFAKQHERMVIKSGPLLGAYLPGKRLLTSIIQYENIDPEVLRRSPCLFQEYIPKLYELRVHVIGNRVLTCRIDSQSNESTRIDWRNFSISKTPHYKFELSKTLDEACCSLVSLLRLELGILDLIVTPEGETVFLECNSQGHWLWIEELTGLPITNTIAERLYSNS
jgi:glutathione synthase/RimK-type ligase-like ATP-grasp enzyme